MLAPLETTELLLARLAGLQSQIPWSATDGLVSVILELPAGTACDAFPAIADCFRLVSPGERETRIGCGTALQQGFSGEHRLLQMQASARRLRNHWLTLDPDETGMQPAAMVAAAHYPNDSMQGAWQGLPNALLWVPAVALHAQNSESAAIFSTMLPADSSATLDKWRSLLEPLLHHRARPPQTASRLQRIASQPEPGHWPSLVRDALSAIDRQALQKAVLVRHIRVRGERRFDPQRLHSALAYLFPDCQILQIRLGGRLFAAATPERLVSLRAGRLEVDAIAGTAARAAGNQADAELAHALQHSPKQQQEHQLVVQSIREQLTPASKTLEIPGRPRLLQLTNVQHLWTPIRGRVRDHADLLGLAAALHPTPATSGYPVTAARDWLQNRDAIQRGWYTGVAGWLTPDLEGELWVLLRCALLEDDIAQLYAGAGITGASLAEEEWQETEQKLGGMLAALSHA